LPSVYCMFAISDQTTARVDLENTLSVEDSR